MIAIGIDIGKGKHAVAVIDEVGRPLCKSAFYPDFPRSHPISTFPKRITDKTGANADRFAGYCLRKTGKFV